MTGAQSANHMQYDVSINFQKGELLVGQKYFRMEILGPINWCEDVAKERGLEPKVNGFKICV